MIINIFWFLVRKIIFLRTVIVLFIFFIFINLINLILSNVLNFLLKLLFRNMGNVENSLLLSVKIFWQILLEIIKIVLKLIVLLIIYKSLSILSGIILNTVLKYISWDFLFKYLLRADWLQQFIFILLLKMFFLQQFMFIKFLLYINIIRWQIIIVLLIYGVSLFFRYI